MVRMAASAISHDEKSFAVALVGIFSSTHSALCFVRTFDRSDGSELSSVLRAS